MPRTLGEVVPTPTGSPSDAPMGAASRRRLRPVHAVGLASVLLGVGYLDLAIGGNSIAAVLLSAGYVVGVPLAILTR